MNMRMLFVRKTNKLISYKIDTELLHNNMSHSKCKLKALKVKLTEVNLHINKI